MNGFPLLYLSNQGILKLDRLDRWAPRRLLARLRPVLFNFMFMASLIFITGLPKVKDLGLIMVVVDRFSKYASFSPAPHACTAEVAADLFFKNVVKYWLKIPADGARPVRLAIDYSERKTKAKEWIKVMSSLTAGWSMYAYFQSSIGRKRKKFRHRGLNPAKDDRGIKEG
ncbi:hypothetical protein VNO77_46315 [Canavalia gladiata]|uniref:Uncharacterized protein n=1 Tax=Canavalia gladiata TaxID=3824 RepID=A0AAN9PHW7_CANGL